MSDRLAKFCTLRFLMSCVLLSFDISLYMRLTPGHDIFVMILVLRANLRPRTLIPFELDTAMEEQAATLADAAERVAEPDVVSFPPDLTLRFLTLLAPDERLRAALVCRAWRQLIASPPAWATINFATEAAPGAAWPAGADAAALVLRAGGSLKELDFSGGWAGLVSWASVGGALVSRAPPGGWRLTTLRTIRYFAPDEPSVTFSPLMLREDAWAHTLPLRALRAVSAAFPCLVSVSVGVLVPSWCVVAAPPSNQWEILLGSLIFIISHPALR